MKFKSLLFAGWVAVVAASPVSPIQKRAACAGNTNTTRSTWCDYSTSTDYYTTVPDTGVTREYWLEMTDVTVAPDGVSRVGMAINGSIPGPTLYADWGDTVTIHVTNSLTTSANGTSIHWHGIRQNYTNQNDGVVSVTQCPTAVGDTMTYTWRATQYGTSWYHSHIGLQAYMGVFGGLIINGPATADYDEDKGTIFLNDWSHETADSLWEEAQTSGPPTLDNGLINGTNVYGEDGVTGQTGTRFNTSFTAGTSYRLRLISGAIDTHWKFSIDNHTLTVIASDLVPITPYTTTQLNIGMGQRYDVIVTADQSAVATDFWMRAIPQTACSDVLNPDNIKGIVYYGSTPGTPTTSAWEYTDSCDDETANLVPYVVKAASAYTTEADEPVTVGRNADSLFRWYLNSTTMQVEWADPTLLQIYNNVSTWNASSGVIELPNAGEWSYVVIETTLAVPHPIHLHGHDFFIIAQGTGTYDSTATVSLTNPPRRDVAMLPASGYLVLGFETDNPGAWLMHCHIGWHVAEGFALQFIERQSEITALIDYSSMNETCTAWTTYGTVAAIEQEDSGV